MPERDIDDSLVPELLKLSKEVFDLDSVISAAEELLANSRGWSPLSSKSPRTSG